MKIEYRKRIGNDTWHFRRTCSNDPHEEFSVLYLKPGERPRDGELCNECLAKEKTGE